MKKRFKKFFRKQRILKTKKNLTNFHKNNCSFANFRKIENFVKSIFFYSSLTGKQLHKLIT